MILGEVFNKVCGKTIGNYIRIFTINFALKI